MYYLNAFLLYGLFGFIMESTLFKVTEECRVSGVLYGPITIVYGLGGLALILTNKYILNKIKTNKILKIILSFIILAIILTIVELISGYLCKIIFNTEMWNYCSKSFNIGKYICLEYIPLWGLMGVLIVDILKPFFDKIIKLISKEATYLFYFILILDIIITLITK